MWSALKESGCLFVELGESSWNNKYDGTLERFVLGMMDRGWILRERIVISKNSSTTSRKKSWAPSHTMMYFFSKSDEYKFDRDRIRRPFENGLPRVQIYDRQQKIGNPVFPDERGKIANNIIEVKNEKWMIQLEKKIGKSVEHPAVFSRDLPVEPILATTDEGDVVLDCFSGTGTTGVVCIQTNRKYIGIEVNEVFANLSRVRLSEAEKEHQKQLVKLQRG